MGKTAFCYLGTNSFVSLTNTFTSIRQLLYKSITMKNINITPLLSVLFDGRKNKIQCLTLICISLFTKVLEVAVGALVFYVGLCEGYIRIEDGF